MAQHLEVVCERSQTAELSRAHRDRISTRRRAVQRVHWVIGPYRCIAKCPVMRRTCEQKRRMTELVGGSAPGAWLEASSMSRRADGDQGVRECSR